MGRKENIGINLTDKFQNAINLGSYNYLGFATAGGSTERPCIEILKKYGLSTCSSSYTAGKTHLHNELEQLVSEFLNVEDSLIFGMGWATNTNSIPSLVS